MPRIRIATFNVENLFGRAKAINLASHELATDKLGLIAKLQTELNKPVYDKSEIAKLYDQVRDYVKFNIFSTGDKVGRYLITKKSTGGYTVHADGKDDWLGVMEFKRDNFNEAGDKNAAKVIRYIDADIMCMVEVEDRLVLKRFNGDRLYRMYPENMLIDGNDSRGIDVGIYSKFKIGEVRSHIFEGTAISPIFPRDCLEVEIILDNGESIYFLINHFTSKAGGSTTAAKRKRQSTRVAEILKSRYNLKKDKVVVAGDFNDTPDSDSLAPLLSLNNLKDVLKMQFPGNPKERWTYHYKSNEQIDYILVSAPLAKAAVFKEAGVFRKGMADVEEFSDGQIQSYSTVTNWRDAASDHGAVWADFNI